MPAASAHWATLLISSLFRGPASLVLLLLLTATEGRLFVGHLDSGHIFLGLDH